MLFQCFCFCLFCMLFGVLVVNKVISLFFSIWQTEYFIIFTSDLVIHFYWHFFFFIIVQWFGVLIGDFVFKVTCEKAQWKLNMGKL